MRIAVFEAGLPNCAHDAGSTAVVELCIVLQAMGHSLTYVYTGHNPWGREDDLQAHGITAIKAPTDRAAFLHGQSFDAAIISRPGPAAQWIKPCMSARLRVIYFGHDIHHIRLLRGNLFVPEAQRIPLHEIAAIRALERYIWRHSAAILYPSQEECDVVNEYCPTSRALAFPYYELESFAADYRDAPPVQQAVLLFVGGAHHKPNHDAMGWFIDDVLPHVRTRCELRIVGDWPQEFIRTHPQATFLGRLSRADLYQQYGEAALIIAPLRYGAGVKRKVVEALVLGKPVLSTDVGFEGIALPASWRQRLISASQAEEFAKKLEWLLEENVNVGDLSQSLLAHYNDRYRSKLLEKAFAML